MTGRPTIFSQEMADDICAALSGGMSLRAWCNEDGRPAYGTVFRWLKEDAAFCEAYAHAREVQAHNDADRINQVLEACERLQIPPDVARVVVDGLKWTAARRAPKAYGDKLVLGSNDGAPLVVRWGDGSE